jgi:hypothetical protein
MNAHFGLFNIQELDMPQMQANAILSLAHFQLRSRYERWQ